MNISNIVIETPSDRLMPGCGCGCGVSCASAGGNQGVSVGATIAAGPMPSLPSKGSTLWATFTLGNVTYVNPGLGEPPTGEPYAGDPPVRFGGRGKLTLSLPLSFFTFAVIDGPCTCPVGCLRLQIRRVVDFPSSITRRYLDISCCPLSGFCPVKASGAGSIRHDWTNRHLTAVA